MTDILLIHGAWHGGWCWDRTAALLRAQGWRVACPDVAGDTLAACAAALPWAPVVVGHSLGGMLAEAMDPAPRVLIHLCSYLPLPGDSMASLDRLIPTPPRNWPRDDLGRLVLPSDAARAMLYDDCRDADLSRLRPQPVGPLRDPLPGPRKQTTRHYVLCDRDRAILPAAQCAMLDRAPVDHLHHRPWGHSPFQSDPQGLADLIDAIAR